MNEDAKNRSNEEPRKDMGESSPDTLENEEATVPATRELYVDADVFEALNDDEEGREGIDWAEKVSPKDWEEHEDRLRSVIDAQQEAEVLGTDVLIG